MSKEMRIVFYAVVAVRNGLDRRWTGWHTTAEDAYLETEGWTDLRELESYILELRMEVRERP